MIIWWTVRVVYLISRKLPQYEIDFVTSSVLHLLNCNFSLPTDILFQRFIIDHVSRASKNYVSCLVTNQPGVPPESKIKMPVHCKGHIAGLCPTLITKQQPKLESCYRNLHGLENDLVHTPRYHQYDYCMSGARTRAHLCVHKLTEACLRANTVSFKTIRLSMEILQNILERDEDIKILYLVRDPRGIISSRWHANQMSRISRGQSKLEAKLLCSRMRDDLRLFDHLQLRYKDNMLLVRYEDLASKPLDFAEVISRFGRNAPLSESVARFVRVHTNATKTDGDFGTMRSNSSRLAYQWKTKLSQSTINIINAECKDILQKLNYDLW